VLVWLLASGWQLSADPRHSGLLVAAWLLPQRVALLAAPQLSHSVPRLAWWAAAVLAVAGAAVLGSGMERLLLLAIGIGGLIAIWRVDRIIFTGSRGSGGLLQQVGAYEAFITRLGMPLGALLASAMLLSGRPAVALGAGLAAIGVALLVTLIAARGQGVAEARPSASAAAVSSGPNPLPGTGLTAARAGDATSHFRTLVMPRRTTYLLAAMIGGALAAAIVASLPQLLAEVAQLDVALLGVALALLGLGALVPRPPVAKLRNRLPPALLVTGLVAGLAVCAALVVLLGQWLVGLLLLPLAGLLGRTLEVEQLIQHRRGGYDAAARLRWLVGAFALGQLAGAALVLGLGREPVAIGGPLVLLALAGVALTALALLLDRRSLGALRHQVQQFSWNARPEPRPFEAPASHTRAARLARWIGRQVELELVDVSLPVSGRRYAIARPSGEGRDSLFEQAKADPERQMPYWAKVWPSGVALADVVVERSAEVRNQQVLELGAGLGVTACAVLEEGGRVLTADYSLLPLALCRLNGLSNAAGTTGSICFNWRDERQVEGVLARHPPISLVLAADVLYEFRDIQPLIDVIERLLAPGGSLWLAEPVRRTAQRFLDTVAESGWQIESRRLRADWPDATDGWVNVHIIRREAASADAGLAHGGWLT
jgi:predicted nicotinamide N-methyase